MLQSYSHQDIWWFVYWYDGCLLAKLCLTFVTPWTVAQQHMLSMELTSQEYWSGLPSPTPGDFPDPGIEPESLASPAMAGRFFTTTPPGKPFKVIPKMLNPMSSPSPSQNIGAVCQLFVLITCPLLTMVKMKQYLWGQHI